MMMQLGVIPTPAMLMGGVAGGSDSLLAEINQELNTGSFFGSIHDLMSKSREYFVNNVTQPIRRAASIVKAALNLTSADDVYIPITNEDLLRVAPPIMHMPILTHAPMKKLFDEGRIFGWGYEYVPDDDPYGRLIKNGVVEDVGAAMDKDGWVEFTYHFKSDDPDLSFSDLDAIEATRDYIDHLMETTDIDPTDPIADPKKDGLKFNTRG